MEKDPKAAKLFFQEEYIYADHSYKYLPKYKDQSEMLSEEENWPSVIDEKFDGILIQLNPGPLEKLEEEEDN